MRLELGIAALALAAAAPARADDSDVLQIKQAFVPRSVEVATGTTVNFVNADDVNHNLVVVAPDGSENDRGVEKPGDTTQFTFAKAGVYSVICHIHPRMKMKVTVADAPAAPAKPAG